MERWKTFGAIAFVVLALCVLLGSVNTTSVKNLAGAGLIAEDNAKPAADFTLPVVGSGKSVTLLAEAKQHPVVFSFWATWCGPCRMELPHLEALSKKYAGKVSFYGVNSNDPADKINEFTKTNSLSLPMLLDAKAEAATKYGVDAIPLLVVVDTQGKVRAVNDGFDPDIDKNLPAILDAVLSGH